jgi:hypothetical protein
MRNILYLLWKNAVGLNSMRIFDELFPFFLFLQYSMYNVSYEELLSDFCI